MSCLCMCSLLDYGAHHGGDTHAHHHHHHQEVAGANFTTEDKVGQWLEVDLGPRRLLYASYYSLQHHRHDAGKVLRNWVLQGRVESKDRTGMTTCRWVTLRRHNSDLGMVGRAIWVQRCCAEIVYSLIIPLCYLQLATPIMLTVI